MEKSCDKVWAEIAKLREAGVDTRALEDAFTDFEMSFDEHKKEH